jgi:uncharacterized membrane protein YeaQ/YmgE (transglycosylase-associated protein family)
MNTLLVVLILSIVIGALAGWIATKLFAGMRP